MTKAVQESTRLKQRDKAKSCSGMKLSSVDGDWELDYEQWWECQGKECKIFQQSCQVQRFNQGDNTKSWCGLELISACGDWDVDKRWLECWGCDSKWFKNSCQVQILINDGTTIVLLDSLADPQSNWIEISIWWTSKKPLTEGLSTGLILIDCKMESSCFGN